MGQPETVAAEAGVQHGGAAGAYATSEAAVPTAACCQIAAVCGRGPGDLAPHSGAVTAVLERLLRRVSVTCAR